MGLKLAMAFSYTLYGRENVFDDLLEQYPQEHVKLIRYPAKVGSNATFSIQNQGVGVHKDGGFLTFLLLDDVDGLEVELDSGKWIAVSKKERAFVINIGELLEFATDVYLKATRHRVYSPTKDRISITLFLSAQLDKTAPIFALPRHLAKQVRDIEMH